MCGGGGGGGCRGLGEGRGVSLHESISRYITSAIHTSSPPHTSTLLLPPQIVFVGVWLLTLNDRLQQQKEEEYEKLEEEVCMCVWGGGIDCGAEAASGLACRCSPANIMHCILPPTLDHPHTPQLQGLDMNDSPAFLDRTNSSHFVHSRPHFHPPHLYRRAWT